MYLRHCLITLSLALAAFSSPIKRDATTVENDITNIDSETKSLDASITAYPSSGGSVIQAFGIANSVVTLDDAVKSATSDTSASDAFTEAQGGTILGLFETLASDIQETLTDLVDKQGALASLPIPGVTGIVQHELQTLKGDSDAFVAALVAKTPSDLVGTVQAQAALIDAAFNNAIAAFSS